MANKILENIISFCRKFLYFANFDYYNDYEINNFINNIDKRSNPLDIYDFI
jgi:hypothetical protein